MAAFFPELLDGFITSDFLDKVRGKFHFEERQMAEIRTVADAMLPLMCKEAFWERQDFRTDKEQRKESPDAVYEKVAMSLGNGVDILQDRYSAKGLLLQSYIVEVLASELLMQGYEAYNKYVTECTGWHVAKYHFPGSEKNFPLEILPQLLKEFEQKITCNSACCIQPKKSVVFISELTQDETVYCKGICAGCNNIHCANRIEDNISTKKQMTDVPLTYGYSRIFGIVS